MDREISAIEVGLLLGASLVVGYAIGAGAVGVPFVFVPASAFKGGALEKAWKWATGSIRVEEAA
jgi:hypothetical protein